MVSVIIPALNEEKTIRQVVNMVASSPLVNEILVIDDKSFDNTIKQARLPKVRIYTSPIIGKGNSMRDGMLLAKNEVIVYLDADIITYPENIVELLSGPILADEADFVKSNFARQAGRVTELVAKPLLSLLFPEALRFSQPLSGMIAGKKSIFEKVKLEDDYGVDIGILLDMLSLGCRIKEVSIGHIENKMKQWQQLEPMAREVANAILKRARILPAFTLDALKTTSLIL